MPTMMSFDDIRRMVSLELDRTHGVPMNGPFSGNYPYIEELFPDYVIYALGEKYFRRAYSIIDDAVVLGEATEVEEIYIPKQALIITVDSLDGVAQVDVKRISREKGIYVTVVPDDGRILQFYFDKNRVDARWSEETALNYIRARQEKKVSSILQATLGVTDSIKQSSLLPPEFIQKLKDVDPEPFGIPIEIKYGIGSNKQSFDQAFFQKAGAKFEGTPLFINHSDLGEFGDANPIGTIAKFAGADEAKATFIAYVSASEGTWKQKIRESQALGNLGFVRKVSIEGIPSKDDFTVDQKTGIKHFHDLAMPTGIAIVNREGLKGSQIV